MKSDIEESGEDEIPVFESSLNSSKEADITGSYTSLQSLQPSSEFQINQFPPLKSMLQSDLNQ